MSDTDQKIKFIRLVTGEDLVSEVDIDQYAKGKIVLLYPLKLMYMPSVTVPGNIAISFMSWVFTSIVKNQVFHISDKDILFVSDITDDVIQHYKKTKENLSNLGKLPPGIDELDEAISSLSDEDIAEGIREILKTIDDQNLQNDDESKKFVTDWFKKNTGKGKLH